MKELKLEEPAWVTNVFWDALDLWLAYKKERKQAYKPIGEHMLIKRLFRDFPSEAEAVAAIEYSMSQNYQGIFAEKKAVVEPAKKGMFDPNNTGPGLKRL